MIVENRQVDMGLPHSCGRMSARRAKENSEVVARDVHVPFFGGLLDGSQPVTGTVRGNGRHLGRTVSDEKLGQFIRDGQQSDNHTFGEHV